MELFVTKASKQHKNMIFRPFTLLYQYKSFFDNIAARLKSRNAFPFLRQLSSLFRLIIFYRGDFHQDYLSFSFSWMERGDWLVITTDDQTLFSSIHQTTPWWYLIYLVTGGEEKWKIFFHWRGNRMGKAKEGSIWKRKTFGEWRRSRIDKKREENICGRIPWVGFLRPSLAWLEDQGRLNDCE